MRHLLSTTDLSRDEALGVLDTTDEMARLTDREIKKLPTLRGRTVVNLFFEDSTRTRISFTLAAQRLSADIVDFTGKTSSVSKGETLVDTARNIEAMGVDVMVVRHASAGAPHMLARKVNCSVVNAGDGAHEHPTQALLDALTIRRRKGRLQRLTVAICGDILHSRVARSNVALLNLLNADVRLCAPATLMPADVDRWGVSVFHDLDEALEDCDAVMTLRLQRERMSGGFIPSAREYAAVYGLDHERMARCKPGALVLHPGPMNRGVEIDGALADDPQISLVLDQVEAGVAVRMAVLELLAGRSNAVWRDGEAD
jgi:aspartate carbamoyltransferase catalytic subunit